MESDELFLTAANYVNVTLVCVVSFKCLCEVKTILQQQIDTRYCFIGQQKGKAQKTISKVNEMNESYRPCRLKKDSNLERFQTASNVIKEQKTLA